jgi:hypothetical protein
MCAQVELGSFVRWLKESEKRIGQTFAEIEEVQQRFNGIHSELMAEWTDQVEALAGRLASEESLPAEVAQPLAISMKDQHRRLVEQSREFSQEVTKLAAEEQDTLSTAQQEAARVRQLNPALDKREEHLKGNAIDESERLAQLQAQLAERAILSRWFGSGDLRKEILRVKEKHAKTLMRISQTRQKWISIKEKAGDRQAELQAQWRQAATAAAQARAKLEHIQSNIDRLSAERGAQAYLAGLDTAPTVVWELKDELGRVARLNTQIAAYRDGMGAVAEGLGALGGVRTGVQRLLASADKVLEEQTKYNLKRLFLNVPKDAIAFHNQWHVLQKGVRNERRLGRHPAEFSVIMRKHTKSHLGEQGIQTMFESLGEALSNATKAWD